MKEFYDLRVWKLAREYQTDVRSLIKRFPKSEQYNLTDNLSRSSRSVSDNIAEGYGKFYHAANLRHLRDARGSLAESLNQLLTAAEENYITLEDYNDMLNKYKRLIRSLNAYMANIEKWKRSS